MIKHANAPKRAIGTVDTIANENSQFDNSYSQVETDELVFGIVGYRGAVPNSAIETLKSILESQFNYQCEIINSVSFIRSSKFFDQKKFDSYVKEDSSNNSPSRKSAPDLLARAVYMQDVGNEMRRFRTTSIIEHCISRKFSLRKDNGGFSGKVPQPMRFAYIVDSIKHPDEIDMLRRTYGDSLHIIGFFSNLNSILESLRIKLGVDIKIQTELDKVMKLLHRDARESVSYGQQVQKALVKADYFIDSHDNNKISKSLERFLKFVFNGEMPDFTKYELGMSHAFVASLSSLCMSRHVGAAIVDASGNLLATGHNDVPSYGGGLYTSSHKKDDRCSVRPSRYCSKDDGNNRLQQEIVERLIETGLIKPENTNQVKQALKKTKISDLLENSRSIHAEMDALMSLARSGRQGVVGSTLYTTTYPCHNCARHIVAAGICEVVYIEPYLKSKATELHSDSITESKPDPNATSEQQQMYLSIYEGVNPESMVKYARAGRRPDKKSKDAVADNKNVRPALTTYMGSFFDLEAHVHDAITENHNA